MNLLRQCEVRSSDSTHKTGLALAGGAVPGAAHTGGLKVPDEAEVRIGRVSGTTAGALNVALHACGKSLDDIETVIIDRH